MKLLQPAKHLSRVLIGLSIFAAGSVMAQQAHTLLRRSIAPHRRRTIALTRTARARW